MSDFKKRSQKGLNCFYVSEQFKADRETINSGLTELGLSANALAKAAGISATSISLALREKYDGDVESVFAAAITTLANIANERRMAGVMPFVKTSVYKLAKQICDEAFINRGSDSIGLFCGHVGVGKTTALKKICQDDRHAIYIRASQGMAKSQALDFLSRAVGLPVHQKMTISQRQMLIGDALRDQPRLIILDEATRPQKAVLECYRDIVDEAESGLVLAGREMLADKLSSNESDLAEIASRILTWVPPVRSLKYEDVMMILDASNAQGLNEKCREMVYQCSESNGRVLKHLITRINNYLKNHDDITPAVISKTYMTYVRPQSPTWRKQS